MGIIIVVLSGFALSLVAPWLYRLGRGATGWAIALLPAGLALYLLSLLGQIANGEAITTSIPWVPSLGINLSFYVDGLSLIFALLITVIGALVIIYAGAYLAGNRLLGRFYTLVLMFMGSMLGLVLADNLITMFVFWELTGLTSYLLIGLDHERKEARDAALQALLVTGAGGLSLLIGLLLLAYAGGSLELSTLLSQGAAIRGHAFYFPILLLILIGASTKSAQVPFHFWLPNAMEAPTPVSAYLHSATMVKAGVYLLARLSPILGSTDAWNYLVTLIGLATMLLGAILALMQTDLKRILAYSTVSTLGALVLLIGLDTVLSVKAAMVFLLVHALYKGALFLIAGALDHETGTRDVGQLGGLAKAMPITAFAAALAALSMAGLPPMLGFINKELFYEAKLQAPRAAGLITSLGVLANMLLVAVAAIVGIRPFFGRKKTTPKKPHEAPLAMWLGPILLGVAGLINGLLPDLVPNTLISAAVSAVRAESTVVELALWHGLNPVFALSVLTVVVGLGLYAALGTLRSAWHFPSMDLAFRAIARWGPQRWYDLSLKALNALARSQTRFLQSGYLRFYLMVIILTTTTLGVYTLLRNSNLIWPTLWPSDIWFFEWVVGLIILAAALMAVLSRSRLAAVAALGVVGYGVALIYTLFSAPDLAMTQFAIETLTVILFVLVLYRLPTFSRLASRPARIRDALVALAAGGFMTSLVLLATSLPFQSRLAPYFTEHCQSLAKGRNIVNVILVDFRALDTLGEISVLAVAAIGVYALLKLRLE